MVILSPHFKAANIFYPNMSKLRVWQPQGGGGAIFHPYILSAPHPRKHPTIIYMIIFKQVSELLIVQRRCILHPKYLS